MIRSSPACSRKKAPAISHIHLSSIAILMAKDTLGIQLSNFTSVAVVPNYVSSQSNQRIRPLSNQVLLNGTPGDPLSLVLFIIVMGVLSSLFKHADDRGLLHDLAIRNVKSRLSIYADDVVLFVKPMKI
jgi:hypothetical protein